MRDPGETKSVDMTIQVSGTHVYTPSARRRLHIYWIRDFAAQKGSVDMVTSCVATMRALWLKRVRHGSG